MKCGTTALWHNCNQHPDIVMGKNPEDPKLTSTEIRFWNNGGPYHTFKKGIKWYRSLFTGKLCGEKCANYIESPTAMLRMHGYMPTCKLIVCVRNPVDRILSEFWMHNFDHAKIAKFPKFSRGTGPRVRGCYMDQIYTGLWRTGWNPAQVYVLIQERMKNNIIVEMNKLFKWLGLTEYSPKLIELSFKERTKSINGFRSWHTTHGCDMSSTTRAELTSYYNPHNLRLREFLKDDILEWEC